MKKTIRIGLLVLGLAAAHAHAGNNHFCAGTDAQTQAGTGQGLGDQSLEFVVDQPASQTVCMSGYELEKCGDHENASKIYDKCIAAGYLGAMINRSRMLETGFGHTPPDLVAATDLMRRVAASGHSPFATLGKLHYASALYQGKGVARDEAQALKWFEAAAKDGSPDAIEFLRTGHHTGEHDAQGRGVGPLPSSP
jgi:hypothetical protein